MMSCGSCVASLRGSANGKRRRSPMELAAQRKICETCSSSVELEMPSGVCPACLLTTVLEAEGETVAGTRIDDYELLNEIARGGMGIVYRARQRVPLRIVALKMILPMHLSSPGAVHRFRAEGEADALRPG